ncbi:MAG: hypothetical protein ABSG07_22365 [Terriglobales bacterium]|jgi:hypothetical protein
MPRMLDLIRNSEVPSNLMQSAARGSLSVPPDEMIEILVYLALHNKLFSERARLTLAGWDEKASLAAAANPKTSAEVLGYFVSLENLRPSLLPALAENLSVREDSLAALAVTGARSTLEILLMSPRAMNSPGMLRALQSNPNLRPNEQAEIGKKLAGLEAIPTAAPPDADAPDEVVEGAVIKYLEENAAELAVETNKPFQPIGMAHEETDHERRAHEETHGEATIVEEKIVAEPQAAGASAIAGAEADGKSAADVMAKSVVKSSTTAAAGKSGAAAAAAAIHAKKHHVPVVEERRDSTLQKISKLDIKGRIALAMRGSKEERSILVRDSTKLVAVAVLESPKVTDGEVEKFALQKNVLEAVLRTIPMKRKFAKNYSIMRNLVYNPRTPLDLSLTLMKNLLIHDLKNLSDNKEVSDTIRKLALRMFKQKMEKKG